MPVIYLLGDSQRAYAAEAIRQAPQFSTVSILAPTRTPPQNKKLWAMLRDVSQAKPEGRLWVPDTWKAAFMHSSGHQCQFAEGLDGSGPFPVGYRSSHLNVQQMRDLIEVIYEYGSRHAVQWTEAERSGFA
ncbi:recombination protein NinB [Paracoccus sp. AS002]|uniref:recombination protein NinB n=1 Tax=Paracoccus sp. AS002 TaxID=3019545 RepID=UPI0023E89D72|nr:recombination protein NinB [Paracoccus sp. AS002]MDF3904655.1 recombination protein NinB [Paracoccus sp. AS002]